MFIHQIIETIYDADGGPNTHIFDCTVCILYYTHILISIDLFFSLRGALSFELTICPSWEYMPRSSLHKTGHCVVMPPPQLITAEPKQSSMDKMMTRNPLRKFMLGSHKLNWITRTSWTNIIRENWLCPFVIHYFRKTTDVN